MEILNELESVAPGLVPIQEKHLFSIPFDYFLTFENRLLIKIASLNKSSRVPQDYFEQFPQRIINKIRQMELEEIAGYDETKGILSELKDKQVFTVPTGYFEQFSIPAITTPPQQAIVRPLFPKRFIWKNAVAALVTGVIAINALWVFNQDGNNSQLSSVSENPAVYTSIQAAKKITSEDQINEGIANLSSEDIVKYLSSNGNDMDNENVINNLSENDLPNQDPSFIDKNSIHNFLNN